jgi:hypothetical protein
MAIFQGKYKVFFVRQDKMDGSEPEKIASN